MRLHNNRQGSALLLTLLIVSLLLVIVLSFVVYVRMNLRTMDQNTKNVQARQNALVALQIALGELQEAAGPDQRITTTADAVATRDIENITTPDPIFPAETDHIEAGSDGRLDVQAGGRFWTAVWGNGESDIGYDLRPENIPPISGHQSGVTPVFLNWLVSGNEGATKELHPNLKGGINPSTVTVVSYQPNSVNLSDPENPTINGSPAVLLVGPNSVGTSSVNEHLYVAAPLVEIPSATIGSSEGRYAWWVGDEGVKARMNLVNGYQQSNDSDDEINSFLVAQRSGVEFMNQDPAGTTNPSTLTDYPGNDVAVSKLLDPEQLLFLGTSSVAQDNLREGQQNRFHDLTTYSLGVLSDPYAGGLKKDLTADIVDTSSTSSGNRPADEDFIYPALKSAPSDPQRATWGLIRSWARSNPPSPGAAIDPIPPSPVTTGIGPTISYFSMGFNYFLDGSELKLALYPFISLHNPYPIPIAAADYEIGLHLTDQAVFTVQIDEDGLPEVDSAGVELLDTNGNFIYSYDDVARIDLNTCSIYKESDAPPNGETFFRFKLKGSVIPPGERHIYLLRDLVGGDTGATYVHTNPPVLERAPNSDSIGETNYVVLDGPSLDLSSATPEAYIRLGIHRYDDIPESFQFTEISLALAKDEALSGTTWEPEASGIYQAMNNVIPIIPYDLRFGGQPGAVSKQAYYCATTSLGELITDKQTIDLQTSATSAVRILTPYEARGGGWANASFAGFRTHYYSRRPIADGSLRAPHIMATSIEASENYPDNQTRKIKDSVGAGIFGSFIPGGLPLKTSDQRDGHPGVNYYRYTTGVDSGPDANSALRYVILWDLLDSPDRLLSLGQLQHVPFSKYDFQPSYLFGNSYALKRIPRNQTYNPNKLRKLDESAFTSPTLPLYDESWHLNRAIWDQYFVSGVPSDLSQADLDNGGTLPNARIVPYKTTSNLEDLNYTTGTNKAYENAAANLMVLGSFNINSTSEQAWRAILGGTVGIPSNDDFATIGDAVGDVAIYPRFSRNLSRPESGIYPAQTVTMRWNDAETIRNILRLGNRGLYLNPISGDLSPNNSVQEVINELAHSIVQEIRLRGPFLSLSDFINRPLTDPPPGGVGSSTPQQLAGIKGVLQAGIDNMDPNQAQVNPYSLVEEVSGLLQIGQSKSTRDRIYEWDDEHAVGGKITIDETEPENAPAEAYRGSWSMAPLWITQADLLSTLGPLLSARSDTFIIRTYGEQIAQGSDSVEARAWCEAVVQRYPDYIDNSQLPIEAPNGLNLFLGRRFRIISFRWLTPSDI